MKLPAQHCIAPSILAADFTRLGEEVQAVTRAGAHYIHIDVMDGHFVPNITLGPDIVAAIKRCTHLPLDVHLMIEKPERYVADFIRAGANIVSVQAEACTHLHRVVQQIRELGASPGVVLNPATSIHALDEILQDVDVVMIMTVNPGFGGQKPIRKAIEKVARLRTHFTMLGLDDPPAIEVDGGVKLDNLADFCEADLFVSGSGIFQYPESVEKLDKNRLDIDALTEVYSRVIRQMQERLHVLAAPTPPPRVHRADEIGGDDHFSY